MAGGITLSAMLASLPLPSGDLGTMVTLGQMRSMVLREFLMPEIRLTATSIAAATGPSGGEQATAIRNWLEDHTVFVRDPDGVEMLHGPRWQVQRALTRGMVSVDCDDVAMLAAALGKSIGLKARFTVVGFGSPKAPYRHVWTELAAPGSPMWTECDITRPAQGLPMESISRVLRVEV